MLCMQAFWRTQKRREEEAAEKAREEHIAESRAEAEKLRQVEKEARAHGETIDKAWRQHYKEGEDARKTNEALLAEAAQHQHKGPASRGGHRKLVKTPCGDSAPRSGGKTSLEKHEEAQAAHREAQEDYIRDPTTGKWVVK